MNKAKRILNEIASLEQQLAKIQLRCKHPQSERIFILKTINSSIPDEEICEDCQLRFKK